MGCLSSSVTSKANKQQAIPTKITDIQKVYFFNHSHILEVRWRVESFLQTRNQ
jgi:hypothetical protein